MNYQASCKLKTKINNYLENNYRNIVQLKRDLAELLVFKKTNMFLVKLDKFIKKHNASQVFTENKFKSFLRKFNGTYNFYREEVILEEFTSAVEMRESNLKQKLISLDELINQEVELLRNSHPSLRTMSINREDVGYVIAAIQDLIYTYEACQDTMLNGGKAKEGPHIYLQLYQEDYLTARTHLPVLEALLINYDKAKAELKFLSELHYSKYVLMANATPVASLLGGRDINIALAS